MSADPKSQAVRDRWMQDAKCPRCPEMNLKGRSPLITLDDLGLAYCAGCGKSWQPRL